MFSHFLALTALVLPILAQVIQFQSVPGPFTIGKPATITWGGSSDTADTVTLTLRKGSSTSTNGIETIGIIGSNLKGNNFTWTPASNLTPGNDYALQITQGLDDTNYSGQFSILAAVDAGTTTILAVGGGQTSAVATITPNVSSTVVITAAGSSSGTGTAMARNTTMVSPTLSATANLTSTKTSVVTSSTTSSTTGTASGSASTGGAAKVTGLIGAGVMAVGAVFLF